MEGISYNLLNGKGKQVGEITLPSNIFAAPVRKSMVHDAVRWQRNERRRGTHSTLTKTTIQGGKKKPWKQKGTGRARAGSSISPHWVGGAVSHGPHPRGYGYRLSKRARWQALAGVLSDKVKSKTLLVVEDIPVKQGKTKEFIEFLGAIGVAGKDAVVVLPKRDELIWRAGGNLPNIYMIESAGVNVYDLLNHHFLVVTKEGLAALEARLEKSCRSGCAESN